MIIEERGFTEEGLPYMIVVMEDFGNRNGYVGVFKNSPLYEKSYDVPLSGDVNDYESALEYHIRVHGGLTYSGNLGQNILGADNPYFFGFDCNHMNDAKLTISEMTKLVNNKLPQLSYNEKQQILNRYKQLQTMIPPIGEEYPRSLDYVRNECFDLSKQLKKMENEYVNV